MGTVVIAVKYIVAILTAVIGVISCFAGFKWFKTVLSFAGALIGYGAGEYLVGPWVGLVFALVFGILAYSFYEKALVFIVAAAVCIMFSETYLKAHPGEAFKAFGIGLIIGIIFGFAVKFVQKGAIIILTSYIGAKLLSQVAVPLLMLIPGMDKIVSEIALLFLPGAIVPPVVALTTILLVGLFVSGFAVQTNRA